MGQQQLLLIVLGVIVVGIAVVVGINLFNANAVSTNRDGVVSDLNTLGAMAQQHLKKPLSMGGGGQTFTGAGATPPQPFEIPVQLDTTANGTYAINSITDNQVIIDGFGTEAGDDGSTVIHHQATITANSITFIAPLN
jgi:hypothetical protein